MKSKIIILIVLLLVHLVIISAGVVFFAYDFYPTKVAWSWYRAKELSEIYQELVKYKDEKGELPESLDSFWKIDHKEHEIFFGERKLWYDYTFTEERIRYEIINGEPVLIDLGEDNKEGGMAMDFDITYPEKYQKKLLFADFAKTDYFYKSLIHGVILGFLISVCLFFIWKKGFSLKKMSMANLFSFAGYSVLFLLFEYFLAGAILASHVYPTH